MSSGCGDVLSLADLQTAKKHQLFEAEVITGKQGGTASGVDIDYATNLVTGQVQKTLPAVLRDVGFEHASFDFTTGGTLTVDDRNKVVYDPVSVTWYSWGGALPKVIPAGTNPLLDSNWKPQTDPNLRDDLESDSGTAFVSPHKVKVIPQGTLAEMQFYVTPDQFGAYVDENTPFTAAIQAAIDYAAAHPGIYVRGTEKIYGTGMLEFTVGCKRVDGLRLKCVVPGTDSVLKSFVDSGHVDVEITNCVININGNATKGVVMSGVNYSKITKNHVYGFAAGGERYGLRIGVNSLTSLNVGNQIKDNVVEMPVDPDSGTGSFGIVGIGLVGPITSIYGGIDTNSGVPLYPSTITLRDTIISGNFITGGTHGIAGAGLFRVLITHNNINGCSHRNINLSANCQRIVVSNNALLEAGSSGVNVAWGSRWVDVTGNYIHSTQSSAVSSDDAAIQMYKGIDQCNITGNIVLGDWKYSLYLGSMVTNITVSGNSFNAGSLANVAVESDWVLTSTYPLAIYSSSRNPATVQVAGDSGNINIGNNNYTGSACAIYLVAVNGKALYNVNVHDEVVGYVTARNHVVYAYDSATLMTDGVLSNIAARGASNNKYYLSRGRTAFTMVKNVTALDDGTAEVSVTGSTPSAVYGPNLYIASGTITNFTNAQDGDEISVRMNDGVILVHNASIMRLRGGVNATASGGLAIVTLRKRAGVWFETARNF